MESKTQSQFFGVFSNTTPSREVSLQVGTINKVENLQYIPYVTTGVEHHKDEEYK